MGVQEGAKDASPPIKNHTGARTRALSTLKACQLITIEKDIIYTNDSREQHIPHQVKVVDLCCLATLCISTPRLGYAVQLVSPCLDQY